MSEINTSPWYRLHHTDQHLWVELLDGSHLTLSSSVLNGGVYETRNLLNMKVPKTFDGAEAPAETLRSYAQGLGAEGAVVGMMTAASMDSMRCYREQAQGVELVVLVTCGLENARCVGDAAEYRSMSTHPPEVGTINIIMLCSAGLSVAAMVEAVQMITEAKTAALMAEGIISPVSGDLATGTGTDSVAVVSGRGDETIHYCGKHVLFGEILGRMTLAAVRDSISWYQREDDH